MACCEFGTYSGDQSVSLWQGIPRSLPVGHSVLTGRIINERRQDGANLGCAQRSPIGAPLTGHTEMVTDATFSPDNRASRR